MSSQYGDDTFCFSEQYDLVSQPVRMAPVRNTITAKTVTTSHDGCAGYRRDG